MAKQQVGQPPGCAFHRHEDRRWQFRPGCCLMLVDAGLSAVGHGDRYVVVLVKREQLAGRMPVTSGGVVARAWRGGRDWQAPLARLLPGTDVAAMDDVLGRRPAWADPQRLSLCGLCHRGMPGRRRGRHPRLRSRRPAHWLRPDGTTSTSSLSEPPGSLTHPHSGCLGPAAGSGDGGRLSWRGGGIFER